MLRNLLRNNLTTVLVVGLLLAGTWLAIVKPALATPEDELDSYAVLTASVTNAALGRDATGVYVARYGPPSTFQAASLASKALVIAGSAGSACPTTPTFKIVAKAGESTLTSDPVIEPGETLSLSAYSNGQPTWATFNVLIHRGSGWDLHSYNERAEGIIQFQHPGKTGELIRIHGKIQDNQDCYVTHDLKVGGTAATPSNDTVDLLTSVNGNLKTKNASGALKVNITYTSVRPDGQTVTESKTSTLPAGGGQVLGNFRTTGTLAQLVGETTITLRIVVSGADNLGNAISDTKSVTMKQTIGADQRSTLTMLPASVQWVGVKNGESVTLSATHTAAS